MAGVSSSNEWSNVVSEVRNDLVFADRNKSYGAYRIRREYTRTIVMALIFTGSSILLAALMPDIISLFKKSEEELRMVNVDITPIDLEAPPIDETEPPPPPPPPPPPTIETVKFTPPVVVDEQVDETPPPQETDKQISTVTQEGSGGDEIIIPDEGGTGVVASEKEEIFTVVEQMPEFPGGLEEMYKFFQKNTNYPQVEKENGIQGKVYLNFTVDREGKISDIKVLRGVPGGPGLEKEAIRVVKMMPPWKAGKQNGRAVSVSYNLPYVFKLN